MIANAGYPAELVILEDKVTDLKAKLTAAQVALEDIRTTAANPVVSSGFAFIVERKAAEALKELRGEG